MSEHTKTPWSFRRIEARDYGECQYSLTHSGDPFVCVGTCITREEDARHIVHCVNNHERLVEALWDMYEIAHHDQWGDVPEAQKYAMHKARELLKEVGGQK